MPCYCPPESFNEKEVKRVCQLLLYVQTKIKGMILPRWVREHAHTAYPDTTKLNHATNTLCEICKGMTQHQKARIIYNGRQAESRRLADWWDEHLASDLKRAQDAKEAKRVAVAKTKAKQKLNKEDRDALGIS